MGNWEYKPLNKLGSISRGKSKHRPRDDERLFGGKYPFIQTAEVKKADFYISEYEKTYSDFGLAQSQLWPKGTLCITIAANIADTAILNMPACFPDSIMGFNAYEGVADNRFVKYSFDYLKENMVLISQGTAQDNLSWKKLSTIKFPAPPYEIQKRIADILSTYDDLIANNQKQIKLLEEAAQRLYKEWFIDLHFPGHEDCKIVDGVPEGWSRATLEELCSLRKQNIKYTDILPNTPYIGLEHMPKKDFCLSQWGRAEIVNGNKNKYLVDDIIFGKIRPYFHKVGFTLTEGVTSTDTFIIVPNDGLWGLVLLLVSSDSFVDYSYQTCKEGAKMPRADWNHLKIYETLIADKEIQAKFEAVIHKITRKIKALALQIRNLQEARDRLLPKLMSGEIEL